MMAPSTLVNAPISSIDDLITANDDLGKISALIWAGQG